MAISSESYTSLFALKLASILADSPHIDSSSKDVFMSQIHSLTSQWLSALFGFPSSFPFLLLETLKT